MLTLVKTPPIKHAIIDINSGYSFAFLRAASDALGKNNIHDTLNHHNFPPIFGNFLEATKWPLQSTTLLTQSLIATQVAQSEYPQIAVIGIAIDENHAEKRYQADELLNGGARIVISSAQDVSHAFNMLNNGYSDKEAMLFTNDIWHNLPRPAAELNNIRNKKPTRLWHLKPVN